MVHNFNPKVSIVIPVYNGSNYVKQAIDSALSQTYKNTEIVVVNDGSTDGGKTDEICRSYGNKIRYFLKKNGGAATALNMGVEKMKGEYFSWLSHDDVYYPNKVEKQVKFLSSQKDRKVILFANYELIDENSKKLSDVNLDHKMLIEKPEYALLRGSINGITLLIPRSAFKDHGGFDGQYRCTQDYELWRKFAKTYKFVHMEDIMTKTRIHELQDSNKHPNVLIEGNPLWIGMMEDLSSKVKERLEGSEYNFYREMVSYLENSPYREAEEYAREKMAKIYNSEKERMKGIKVSIIIPFYNRIPLLLKSVESAKAQTHKNIEILLINDKSTEDITLVEGIVKEDPRIKLFSLKHNSGPAAARNFGMEKVTGEYIAFLDSDDLFIQDKIEEQLTQMILTKYMVSHTSYIRRDEFSDQLIDAKLFTGKVIPKIIENCPIATPTVMINTKYLKTLDLKFNENYKIGEDICFWLELLRKVDLLGIGKVYTVVNINKNSAISDDKKQMMGLSNIIKFVLSDKEYSKYHSQIANLCFGYYEVSRRISPVEQGLIGQSYSFWRNKPTNPILKALYLFKNQGIFTTLKKLFKKYLGRLFK